MKAVSELMKQGPVIGDGGYLIELAQADQSEATVAWLPDGSGVYFNRTYTDAGAPQPPGIYRSDGGVSDLPFLADTIVAVLP